MESVINRYYDPTTDQFLSIDPKITKTGQPYVFTNDDPLNEVDPIGDDPSLARIAFSVLTSYNALLGIAQTSADSLSSLLKPNQYQRLSQEQVEGIKEATELSEKKLVLEVKTYDNTVDAALEGDPVEATLTAEQGTINATFGRLEDYIYSVTFNPDYVRIVTPYQAIDDESGGGSMDEADGAAP